MEKASRLYDIVRLDHFRGIDRYYAIPARSETAENGEWQQGPGMRLFNEIKRRLGEINIIAEDLGILDSGVVRLLEATGFPGMKVLHFAFNGNENNPYLPANIEENSVVYTGTHDNDTTLGFLNSLTDAEFKKLKTRLRAALKGEGVVYPFVTREDTTLALVICALASKADLAIIPVQDVMNLDADARMNTPSTTEGNWQYRMNSFPSRKDLAILRKTVDKFNR